jgi:hypothetical protein
MNRHLIEIWNHLSDKDRLAIYTESGQRVGLPATAIEKDWWVTFALNVVFTTTRPLHSLLDLLGN